jgi:hypothetical protein
MLKLVELKLTKTTLYLTELELLTFLPVPIIETGIKRGKRIKRAAASREAGEGTRVGGVFE